jgi:hypothetical protein
VVEVDAAREASVLVDFGNPKLQSVEVFAPKFFLTALYIFQRVVEAHIGVIDVTYRRASIVSRCDLVADADAKGKGLVAKR